MRRGAHEDFVHSALSQSRHNQREQEDEACSRDCHQQMRHLNEKQKKDWSNEDQHGARDEQESANTPFS